MRGYRLLLKLLPADFRDEYAAEMTQILSARLERTKGPLRRAGIRLMAIADVVWIAIGERRRRRSSGGMGGGRNRLLLLGADTWMDARYAARALRRSPSFTTGAVLTLAMGIGTITALFTVLDGVLLRPLPYPHAERLYNLTSPHLEPENREAWLEALPVVEAAAAYSLDNGSVITPAGAVNATAMHAGRRFAELLGQRPLEGRGFVAADHAPGATPVVLVREDFWRRWWGSAPAVGAGLEVDGVIHEVVGIVPTDFYFMRYRDVELWTPLETREVPGVSLIIRLPEGLSRDDAFPALEALGEQMATGSQARESDGRVPSVYLHNVRDVMLGDVRDSLWILMASATVVLLLAVANVAALWIGRALGRRRELGVRAALGAGRSRLVRQLAVEAMLLAAGGALLGLSLAAAAPSLLSLAPDYLPRTENVGLTARAAAVSLGSALVAALLFGVVPSIAGVRLASMRRDAVGATIGRRTGTAQGVLVVAEVAAALVLVTAAALLLRTWDALRPAEPGFRFDDVAVASFNLPGANYAEGPEQRRFVQRLLNEVHATGDTRAAVVTDLPLTGMSIYVSVAAVDGATPSGERPPRVHFRAATPGYLDIMEMQLLDGRGLTSEDAPGRAPVAVVNESAASRLWGAGTPPLGREVTLSGIPGEPTFRVVGLVRDAWVIRGPEARPEVFASFAQMPFRRFQLVAVRSRGNSPPADNLRAASAAVDPRVPVRFTRDLKSLISGSVVVPRFQASVLVMMAAVALFLAAVGCFAVLTQTMNRRKRELGIRLALGASAPGIAGLVMGRAGRLAVAGIVVGAVMSWAGMRVLEAHLYGVEPRDPFTFAMSALILLATVMVAALRPALHASRVEPVRTLREE